MRWKIAAVVAAAAVAGVVGARADYFIPVPVNGATSLVFAFVCVLGGVSKQCPAHVLIDRSGAEKGTAANPIQAKPGSIVPLGFQNITNLVSATGLAGPAGGPHRPHLRRDPASALPR